MRQAGEECRRQGIVFTPLALESLGGWHEVAVQELKMLGSALARQTGQEEDVAMSHLFQKLSVLLMKGNTALVVRPPLFQMVTGPYTKRLSRHDPRSQAKPRMAGTDGGVKRKNEVNVTT